MWPPARALCEVVPLTMHARISLGAAKRRDPSSTSRRPDSAMASIIQPAVEVDEPDRSCAGCVVTKCVCCELYRHVICKGSRANLLPSTH